MGNNMAAFCFWDIISLFVLLAVVIGFVVRTWILRKEEKELERALAAHLIWQITPSGGNRKEVKLEKN